MRTGIRTKLALLVVVTALGPLCAAVIAMALLGDSWPGSGMAAGLAALLAGLLAALVLAERRIARRVHRLAEAVRSFDRDEPGLSLKADWAGRRLLGRDELDELAEDFDYMVGRVREACDQLQADNEMRRAFLQVAGHELRTPLAYILTRCKLLVTCRDVDKLREGVASIAERARALQATTESMLKLVDVEGGAALNLRRLPLSELMEEAYLKAQPHAAKRCQQLVVQCETPDALLRVDRERLLDALGNLLVNAVKFSPDGGRIELQAGRRPGRTVAISVADSGPGIPPEELPHLFTPFYSGADTMHHSSGTDGFGKRGMGLGLAVVKRFVELHGGQVAADSSPGGATFTITLPEADAPPGGDKRPSFKIPRQRTEASPAGLP